MEKICTICKETFEQNENVWGTTMAAAVGRDPSSERCYRCTLFDITGRRAPEEGDFNSAAIISGEMSDQEWRWMQEDFQAIETGRPIREVEKIEHIEWCDICGTECWCNEENTFE